MFGIDVGRVGVGVVVVVVLLVTPPRGFGTLCYVLLMRQDGCSPLSSFLALVQL